MMSEFEGQLDALLAKYTELLLGSDDPALQEKVKAWALYTHISKSMPALVRHWNELYPVGKAEMITLISEIKELNEKHRNQKNKPGT
ncbi:DUF2573 family protein [Peribacillus sp. SCS-37]|uniref:DUF2573 family protein n=1 Tax=Paraperibacillus esterisolvens TaxID=3115296 RepID=UPI003905B122